MATPPICIKGLVATKGSQDGRPSENMLFILVKFSNIWFGTIKSKCWMYGSHHGISQHFFHVFYHFFVFENDPKRMKKILHLAPIKSPNSYLLS